MHRISFLATPLVLMFFVGCGGAPTETAQAPAKPSATATSPSASNVSSLDKNAAKEVVSRFLDEVRRGGADSVAGKYLTNKAQAELKRIGRSVQPLGTPQAKFTVTRGEEVPGEENAVLVHSIWTEPNGEETSEFQVVWAVQKEASDWRISGLAMEIEPGQQPMVIDFENGAMMANLLTPPNEDTASQAAVPQDDTTKR